MDKGDVLLNRRDDQTHRLDRREQRATRPPKRPIGDPPSAPAARSIADALPFEDPETKQPAPTDHERDQRQIIDHEQAVQDGRAMCERCRVKPAIPRERRCLGCRSIAREGHGWRGTDRRGHKPVHLNFKNGVTWPNGRPDSELKWTER